ncbi:MAG: ABC transporter ATP-binding protein, partial [Calditrichaeota bacterium]|nr:ABC transporter ATP-binding protein [Calditrichota bacterium]
MTDPVLRIKNLSFSFDDDLLKRINLELSAQEIVLINGKSGCGKTTLLRLIYGEIGEDEQWNSIHLSGRKETAPYQWKQSDWIGFVQQDPEMQICTNRIEDEIRFGLENIELDSDEIEKRIDFYLDKLGLTERREQSVHGLSGGQKQRLILAAILAMQPKLVLLDEPLAQLDQFAAAEFTDFLDQMRREQHCSFIIVEHRTEQLEAIADQKFTLEEGRLKSYRAYPERYRSLELPATDSRVLHTTGLSFRIDDIPILRQINFTVNAGDCIALLGENGSGKTTLIQALAGLLSCQGTVEISESFAVVFQNPDLMLIENSVKREIPDKEIIAAMDLLDHRKHHPLILSKGQRLRAAVGSILKRGMDLLILDEPTSGQDIDHINQMLNAIE